MNKWTLVEAPFFERLLGLKFPPTTSIYSPPATSSSIPPPTSSLPTNLKFIPDLKFTPTSSSPLLPTSSAPRIYDPSLMPMVKWSIPCTLLLYSMYETNPKNCVLLPYLNFSIPFLSSTSSSRSRTTMEHNLGQNHRFPSDFHQYEWSSIQTASFQKSLHCGTDSRVVTSLIATILSSSSLRSTIINW